MYLPRPGYCRFYSRYCSANCFPRDPGFSSPACLPFSCVSASVHLGLRSPKMAAPCRSFHLYTPAPSTGAPDHTSPWAPPLGLAKIPARCFKSWGRYVCARHDRSSRRPKSFLLRTPLPALAVFNRLVSPSSRSGAHRSKLSKPSGLPFRFHYGPES